MSTSTSRPTETVPGRVRHEAVGGGVQLVVIDNEARRNSLTLDMQVHIGEILERLEADASCRVVVVRGAGTIAFCAGADISEFAGQRTEDEHRGRYDEVLDRVARAWEAMSKPVIASIDGFCIGGGLMTAMHADLRIATPTSSFAIPAARLGVGYDPSSIRQLVHLVGPAHAADVMFTARRFDATEALTMGLVNRVVDAGVDVHDVSLDVARTIAANAPLTIKAAKASIASVTRPDGPSAEALQRLIDACFRSRDYREGQLAFRERRNPRFSGS